MLGVQSRSVSTNILKSVNNFSYVNFVLNRRCYANLSAGAEKKV